VRAGDDGECAGGSGISHANAAGETEGGSACAGRLLAGEAEAAGEARPEAGAAPAPEVVVPAGSSAGCTEAGGGTKLNAGEPSADGCSWSAPDFALGWAAREDPMVSAGSAGTPLAAVPLAGASSFPPAGVPFGETPPPALPSDTASSGEAVLPVSDLAWSDLAASELAGSVLAGVGLRDGCLGGAMMSLVRVSWSSKRLSSAAREVTTVGEPPPEPSGLSLRLSKPSSL
jgi:hypothetical protein